MPITYVRFLLRYLPTPKSDVISGCYVAAQPAYTLYSMLACLCVFSKPFLLFSIVVGRTSATAAARGVAAAGKRVLV